MIKLKELLKESVDKSKLKKVYDNLNKGNEVTIKYGSSISRNNEVTLIVKKGKTTVGKAKVERITLVNKANPKGVKYYLYNRNGNVSLAIGDMAATIDDIQMNESVNESKLSFSQLKNGQVLLNKFRSGKKYTIIDVDSKSATLKNLQSGNTMVIYSLNNYELKESVNEAKDMTFVDYLKVLDDKFLDGMKAVRGDNGSDAQIKPTRGDILQNFTLFRNYLSALTKKYKGDKTKLRFLTERANRLNEIIKSVNEANDTYFKAAYEAAEYAREMAEKKGYEIDEDDWQTQIGMGGKHNRLRPGVGKTHSFTVGLTKNGKPQRKALNISLYGMDSGSYELTYYIN